MRSLALVLSLMLVHGLAVASHAGPVFISEVLADPAGKDDGLVFVEIHGPADLSLDDYLLRAHNGTGGGITHEVPLDGMTIPTDGFLVVADGKSGITQVDAADLVVNDFDLQNGPDSILLLRGGVVMDALAYGTFGAAHLAFGEGDPVATGTSGWSLARRYSNADTDDNASDFVLRQKPTPGTGVLVSTDPEPGPSVPEPGSAALLVVGVLALAARRWRRA